MHVCACAHLDLAIEFLNRAAMDQDTVWEVRHKLSHVHLNLSLFQQELNLQVQLKQCLVLLYPDIEKNYFNESHQLLVSNLVAPVGHYSHEGVIFVWVATVQSTLSLTWTA